MKQYFSSLLLSLLLITGLLSTQPALSQSITGYVIKGTIIGQQSGVIYLKHKDANQKEVTDSTNLVDGNFTFRGKLADPIFHTLYMSNENSALNFLLENSAIEIIAKRDSLSLARVSGSKNQDAMKSFDGLWSEVSGPFFNYMSTATQNGKIKPDSALQLKVEEKQAEFRMKSDSLIKSFVAAHSNLVASTVIITESYDNTKDGAQTLKLLAMLQPEVQQSAYGKALYNSIAKKKNLVIGSVAPEITMNDINGKVVTLSSFRGKYVLIDFWASWCGPCRQENPKVLKSFKKYNSQGFEILGISLDKHKADWLKAIKSDGLSWTHVSDLKEWGNSAAMDYAIHAIPDNYLLDPDGKIIARNITGQALTEKLASIFAGKSK